MRNSKDIWLPNKEAKEDFLRKIKDTRSGNQDFFERHFTYIVAGAIAILISIFPEVISLNFRYSFFVGVSLLAISLMLNLYSYLWSVNFADKNISRVEENSLYKSSYEKERKLLVIFNHVSFFIASIALCFLFYFMLMNLN